MIWEIDSHGLFTYVNHLSETLFGYKPEEMIGRMHFYDVFPESEREAIKKFGYSFFERKEQILNVENQTITKDGRRLWWTTNGIPMLDDNGDLLGYRGSDTDITDKKRLQEQLLQSQKMEAVGQLAGGLAHDFNNVLSIINGYCYLMQSEGGICAEHMEYLSQILAASNRAGNLTHSMLAFCRPQVISQHNDNLNTIIHNVISLIEKTIGDNISLKTALHETAIPVLVDSGQIEQVLINLTNNARDAMPNGGELMIATDIASMDAAFLPRHGLGKQGTYAVITVSDTGAGMDDSVKSRIFEPFFTTKAVDRGTGLGLSMAYGIIKQHNGFIDVASSPGSGTSFHIYLPTIEQEMPEVTSVNITSEKMPAGSETILLAEDNVDLLMFQRNLLTKLGYNVITAVDGQDAVDKFRENADAIQLVITDVVMPKKSGSDAYEEIRLIRPDILTLFCSGYSADISLQRSTLGSNAEYMEKPVQPVRFLNKVREMLDREKE